MLSLLVWPKVITLSGFYCTYNPKCRRSYKMLFHQKIKSNLFSHKLQKINGKLKLNYLTYFGTEVDFTMREFSRTNIYRIGFYELEKVKIKIKLNCTKLYTTIIFFVKKKQCQFLLYKANFILVL